jgi:hypothetical protein
MDEITGYILGGALVVAWGYTIYLVVMLSD